MLKEHSKTGHKYVRLLMYPVFGCPSFGIHWTRYISKESINFRGILVYILRKLSSFIGLRQSLIFYNKTKAQNSPEICSCNVAYNEDATTSETINFIG
jgi:hypothetical protein